MQENNCSRCLCSGHFSPQSGPAYSQLLGQCSIAVAQNFLCRGHTSLKLAGITFLVGSESRILQQQGLKQSFFSYGIGQQAVAGIHGVASLHTEVVQVSLADGRQFAEISRPVIKREQLFHAARKAGNLFCSLRILSQETEEHRRNILPVFPEGGQM